MQEMKEDQPIQADKPISILEERLVLTFEGNEVQIGAGHYPEESFDMPAHLPPVNTVYFKNLGKNIPIDELLNETLSLLRKAMARLDQVYDLVQDEADLPLDGSAEMVRRERAWFRQRADAWRVTWAMTDALIDYCFSNDGRGLKYPRVDQMLSMFTQRPSREVQLVSDGGERSQRYDSDDLTYETDREYWRKYWRGWQLEEEALAHRFKCDSLFAVCLAAIEYTSLAGIELRRCQCCGKIYFKKAGYSYRYCSEACHKKHEAERVQKYRESAVNKKIGQIQSILNGRRDWSGSEAEFDDLLYDLREKRRRGSITEQQMLDELTEYHTRIKRRQ